MKRLVFLFRFQVSGFSPRSGQAMIEFIIGLVAMLALVAALLQIASLTRAQTDTMVDARREAGEKARSDLESMHDPSFIRDWEEGRDERRHTPDDVSIDGDGMGFVVGIVDRSVADPSQWSVFDEHPNQITEAGSFMNPSQGFGLIKGSETENVPLLKAVQEMIYGSESIDVKSDVWMTWTKGIY